MRRRVRPPPERSSQETAVSASRPRVFLPAIAPAGLSPDEQRDYLRRHYWDRFDFTDTLFVSEADTVQMIEAFARYIAVLSDRPADSAPMDSLMRRASSSKPMLDYFAMLAGTVLHDPNSPLRNDEFYIPVLRAQLASPFYDEYERIARAVRPRNGHAEPPGPACQRFPLHARLGRLGDALRAASRIRAAVHQQSRLCDVP
ncbi:MAG: DUF5106 domain-containing protein [Alistipes shahii]